MHQINKPTIPQHKTAQIITHKSAETGDTIYIPHLGDLATNIGQISREEPIATTKSATTPQQQQPKAVNQIHRRDTKGLPSIPKKNRTETTSTIPRHKVRSCSAEPSTKTTQEEI